MSTAWLRRREFVTLIGGGVAWPLVASARDAAKVPVIGVLWHAGSPDEEQPFFGALNKGFSDLGYVDGQNIRLEHRFPNELPDRFKSMAAELVELRVDVLVGVTAGAVYEKAATSTIKLAAIHRLPIGVWATEIMADGVFMSYGPSLAAIVRRAPAYVDKILNGAKPSELPVELPTHFQLIVNLKTAKACGVEVPQMLLAQADHVIE
jgi:hypothetical protein